MITAFIVPMLMPIASAIEYARITDGICNVVRVSNAHNTPVKTSNATIIWLSRDFNVCDPIVPAQGMDRKTYCRQSTENLSNHLEQTVRKFPTQWEAWLYVHNFQPNTHHVGKP